MEKMISVVVPVYNVSAYLKQCIDSLVAQTYKNIEIILINDGSTDNSGEICDEYASNFSNISVFHKENGGLSDARNKGIEIARGDFISFIDSDDYVSKYFYEYLMHAATEYKSDIIICGIKDIDEFQNEFFYENDLAKERIVLYNKPTALNGLYGEYNRDFTVAWNKLYRSTLFKEIRYPKGFIHEDMFVAAQLLSMADKVSYIPTQLYYYRQRGNSIMGTNYKKERLHSVLALEQRLEFYHLNGYTEYVGKEQRFYLACMLSNYRLIRENNLSTNLKEDFIILRKKIMKQFFNLKIPIKDRLRIIKIVLLPL